MPRKSHKKQTRLAFAPAAPTGDDESDDDRHRTLRYNHPSLATVRSSSKAKTSSSKEKKPKSSRKAKPSEPEVEVKAEVKVASPSPQVISSDEDDIVIPSSHRKRKAPISPPETMPRPKGRLKRKAPSSPTVLHDSDDDDEPVLSSPVKRRRRLVDSGTPETPRAGASKVDLEIAEDVEDLQDSDDSGEI